MAWNVYLPCKKGLRAELKRYEERLEEEREREQQEYYKQRQQLEQGD